MSLKIVKRMATNFKYYGVPRAYKLDSIEIHSIGTAQDEAEAIASYMNQYSPGGIVHAIVDARESMKVVELLPRDNVAWADAGYGNHHSYAIEIAESDQITYYPNSANFKINNPAIFKADVYRGYNTAVAYVAQKCTEFGFNPMDKLPNGLYRVYSHQEANRKGLASSHVDPTHIWDRFGLTMDGFRKDVKAAMSGSGIIESKPQDQNNTPNTPVTGDTWYKVQLGAFREKTNADKLCKELQGKGLDAFVRLIGNYYKVQLGAFHDKSNADKLCKKLTSMGYAAFVTTSTGQSTYNSWCGVCTGDSVNVRKGPGTDYANIDGWPKLDKGNEVLVIGESDGWYQIKIHNPQTPVSGYTGYVSAQYIQNRL